MVTDSTMEISKDRTDTMRVLGYWVGFATAYALGILTLAAVDYSTPLRPTELGLDILRTGAMVGVLIGFIVWSTPRAVEDLVRRIGARTDRNRSATEDVRHELDRLRAVVGLGQQQVMAIAQDGARRNQELRHAVVAGGTRMAEDNAQMRELLEGKLAEVESVLVLIRSRMSETTADVITAFEAGIVEGERRSLR